ncbi:hypothetical protein ABZY10_38485 [Streptomyces sp. NPDC006539]
MPVLVRASVIGCQSLCLREKFHDWATERETIDTELDGIARASGIDTDH